MAIENSSPVAYQFCVTPRGTPHSSKGSLVCKRTLIIFSCVLDHISSYEHFSPKREWHRHGKAVRNLWSRFELDPSSVARVVCAQLPAGVDKAISRGFSTPHFFSSFIQYCFISFGCEIMTQRQATAAAAAVHRACYNRVATSQLAAPSSSRQHHARLTRPCCTVSSCLEGTWDPSLIASTRRRYLSAVVADLLRSAQNPHTTHNNSNNAKSTLQPASLSRPAAEGNAMLVWRIRDVLCRVALSNLRSVTH